MQPLGYVPQYHAEVNKGSVNMRLLTGRLNEMGQQCWRPAFDLRTGQEHRHRV